MNIIIDGMLKQLLEFMKNVATFNIDIDASVELLLNCIKYDECLETGIDGEISMLVFNRSNVVIYYDTVMNCLKQI